MKTKLIIFAAVLTMALGLTGCTQQTMTREFGGDMTIVLEPGEKLEEITWNDDDSLWYLTRPMREDEKPETHVFKQSSAWGVFEGTVTIIEKESDMGNRFKSFFTSDYEVTDYELVDSTAECNTRWGYEELHLTDELIDAIKNGKDIEVPVQDEYTLRIKYGEKE